MDGEPKVDSNSWLRRQLQKWLAGRLAESTAASAALGDLDGHSFALRLTELDTEWVFAVSQSSIELLDPAGVQADVTLTATPLDALALAQSQSLTELKRTDAKLEGNIHLAERFASLFALLAPDPEAELAGWVGPIAAHDMSTAGRAVFAFGRRLAKKFELDMADYLLEEQPALARRDDVEQFNENVDDIRDAVERSAQRVTALEARHRMPSR